MSYPTLSPCAIAPIVHAASKRRANLTSQADRLESCSRNVGYTEPQEAASGRPVKSMIELLPVKVVYSKSNPPANALYGKTSSMESCRQNELSCSSVRNYEHLKPALPPASVNGCITIHHNGNNENWYLQNARSICSLDHHGDDYSCNTCKHKRGIPDLWINKSLPAIVTDDNDQGDLIPTIFLTNETGLGEMEKAHQDVNIFATHEKNIEDGLIERGCSTAQHLLPEGNISNLQSEKWSNGAVELSEALPAAAVAYSRDSGEIWGNLSSTAVSSADSGEICRVSSSAVSSAGMTPENLSNTDIQTQRDRPCGFVEIGRCSIYLDTETGEYHSVVNRSFPRKGHSMLNTMKNESSCHRSISHSNGYPSFTHSEYTTRCSSHSLPTHQFSSLTNRSMETNSDTFTFLKEDCADGSADDCGQCIQCQHAFQDCVSAHLKEFYRQLSAPDHQNLGWDLDKDQLVQTYPGTVVCKSEAKSRAHTGVSCCQCQNGKNISATRCADKKGDDCLRCCAPMPSSFEPDGSPMIIQANTFPTYPSFTASCTRVDDHPDDSEKDANRHKSKCPDTKDSLSQLFDDKIQPQLNFSPKRNKLTSSLSSFFGSLLSGKTPDESQKNGNAFGGRQQHPDSGSGCESRLRAASAPGAQQSTAGRDLADPTVAACHRPRSPQHGNGQLCEISNSSSGNGQQMYTMVNPEGNDDTGDENSEANKEKLRIFRQLKRNFAAYLCCPPDALINFGLPFHRLLESWGFSILIPERDLPVPGLKYQIMAEYIEERCNGKIIVILSNTYADSEECLFLTYFAKTLDPDSRHKNIIPVLIDSNPEVPSVLRGLSFIKYNHLVRSGWLKEKLVNAIAA